MSPPFSWCFKQSSPPLGSGGPSAAWTAWAPSLACHNRRITDTSHTYLTGATDKLHSFVSGINGGSEKAHVYADGGFRIKGAGALGYEAGAGGAVTQITSRTTGVTLNKATGAITLVSAAGSRVAASFTVTNSLVAATDTITLSQKSGADKYELSVTAVVAGSFEITFNTKGGTTVEQPVLNFTVVKGAAT